MLSDDISEVIRELRERRARTVALQFPAGLKRRAAEWAGALRDAGFEVIISGDPCYGACDLALDTLYAADVLVHLGHSPVDTQERVIFVPYHVDFDIAVLENALPLLAGTVGLVTTVQHVHLIPAMESFLKEHGIAVRVADGAGRTPHRGQVLGCCFTTARETGADLILFVGTGLFHPIGIALATKARVVALDPLTGSVQEVKAEPLLRRRFAVMEKARAAKTIGIIVSTKIRAAPAGTCTASRGPLPKSGHRYDEGDEPGRAPEPRVRLLCEHRLPPARLRRPGPLPCPRPLSAGV